MSDSPEVYKPSIKDKIRWKINKLKYRFTSSISGLGIFLVKWANSDSNYVKHAKREFEAMGWLKDEDGDICKK